MGSYRPGLLVVGVTILVSLVICLITVKGTPSSERAGQDLGSLGFELGTFRLIERSGRVVTDADLADRVWVASFIFTRCPLSCPRITTVMRGLQDRFAGTNVQLVSITVDPDRDTPEVLAEYAKLRGADRDRWWFLTGPRAEIYELARERFKLGVEPAGAIVPPGTEEISHSSRLALVGPGNKVVGVFDSDDPKAVTDLIAGAKRRSVPAWVPRLPILNATLNSSCVVLLIMGWTMIRTGRVRAHAVCMAAGVLVSALFLTCYLTYHYHVGSVRFRGTGPIRLVYFTILISHTVLAAAVVPFILLTIARAIKRDFVRHARVASTTLPIWLYVSITGVVIYLLLYQMPVASSPGV